jgi:hypothetical protein
MKVNQQKRNYYYYFHYFVLQKKCEFCLPKFSIQGKQNFEKKAFPCHLSLMKNCTAANQCLKTILLFRIQGSLISALISVTMQGRGQGIPCFREKIEKNTYFFPFLLTESESPTPPVDNLDSQETRKLQCF